MEIRASGGIGRRARLKIWFSQGSEGSIPSPPTISLLYSQFYFMIRLLLEVLFFLHMAIEPKTPLRGLGMRCAIG